MSTGVTICVRRGESARKSAPEVGIAPRPCPYLMDDLPPVADRERLARVMRMVPSELRAEAVQVAWVAHLDGASVCTAVDTWRRKEARWKGRHVFVEHEWLGAHGPSGIGDEGPTDIDDVEPDIADIHDDLDGRARVDHS